MLHSRMNVKKKSRSITSRRKSTLPSKEKWKSPAHQLSSEEQGLLIGPSKSISILKCVQMFASRTGRWITYSASQYEQSRVSYVSLDQAGDGTPQFGRITCIFSVYVSMYPKFDNDKYVVSSISFKNNLSWIFLNPSWLHMRMTVHCGFLITTKLSFINSMFIICSYLCIHTLVHY